MVFIYTKKILDNGIVFRQEQIESIHKVIDFIDHKYNSIEKEDIDLLMESIKDNSGSHFIKRFKVKFIALYNKRKKEVQTFSQILLNEKLGDNEKKILAYRFLPFKDSKNIQMESYLYSQFFHDHVYRRYDELLFPFLPTKNNTVLLNKIKWFDFSEGISLSNFSEKSKVVGLDRYPSEDVISSWFHQVKRLYDSKGYEMMTLNQKKIYSSAINQYCEKYVYDYEKNYLQSVGRDDLAQRVIWVSREVSDDFGFNILSFDPVTEKEKMIDVKGTLSYKNMYDFTASNSEFSQFSKGDNYYFYRVFIDDYHHLSISKLSRRDRNCLQIIDDRNHQYIYDSLAFDDGTPVKIKRMF